MHEQNRRLPAEESVLLVNSNIIHVTFHCFKNKNTEKKHTNKIT